ncbi:LysR substrate-binding domain-containing protein [Bordetella sp. BOR01]|uniref:LysR substrate-binding domain-containing protein n=1 Tax=Bordetella sp. BOR01 TaxID=2854779 RepID=UPI001C446526|nr:LysR substrate-binding domain-containing protein [Bordetella sp. BOR01]MBV7481690.1 LysR family transcriptional regulator [Bordetella sp. BOR01]
MELKTLRSFIVLAEELHFGRAAARLHITQPPLSKQIAQLESELGARLFERGSHGVQRTAAGEALVVEARKILAHAEKAATIVGRVTHGDFSTVRIGFNASVMFMGIEHLIQVQRDRLPDLTCDWTEMGTSEQLGELRNDGIDLGFAQPPRHLPGLTSFEFGRPQMMVALPTSHRFAKRRSISLSSLAGEDFVIVSRELAPGYFDLTISACVAAGFNPRLRHYARHLLTVLGLVATTGAVALVPRTLARAAVQGVELRPIQGVRPELSYSIVWNPESRVAVLPRLLTLFGVPPRLSNRR